MKAQTAQTETVMYGCKIGQPDYMEEVLYECRGYTNLDELEKTGNEWAAKNGYDRIRISIIDLSEKPNFVESLNV